MESCPACEADLDLDEEQLLEGGVVSCGGCGAHLEVVNTHPLELNQLKDDDDEDDEDDDAKEDDDDEDDEDDEDENGYDDEDDAFGDEDEEQ